MTAEQLKSLLNHHRRIENLLFRTIVVLVLIAIFIFIVERDITMDSESFNDCFYVTAKVLEEAFCLLTPNMMESILEMANKANGLVYMAFLCNGTVHIAVNNNRDIFELDDSNADYDALHQKFPGKLKWFTDMINVLRLEDTLYQKEANV